MSRKRKVGFEAEVQTKYIRRDEGAAAEDSEEELADGGLGDVDIKAKSKRKRIKEIGTTSDSEESGDDEKRNVDSDDEDQVKLGKYNLAEEDLHEALDTTFQDGGTAVTGFNLDDELQDGHFDEAGNYFEAKDDYSHADEWLQGVKVYHGKRAPVAAQASSESVPDKTKAEYLQEVLSILGEGESVAQALRRLGSQPAAQKWRKPKKGQPPPKTQTPEDKAKFAQLTSCADSLLSMGCYDIYQDRFEKLQHLLKQESAAPAAAGTHFEFKWEDKPEAEVHGPFTAAQMMEWQDSGFFKDGVFCREIGKAAAFYNSKRIDFELFTD